LCCCCAAVVLLCYSAAAMLLLCRLVQLPRFRIVDHSCTAGSNLVSSHCIAHTHAKTDDLDRPIPRHIGRCTNIPERGGGGWCCDLMLARPLQPGSPSGEAKMGKMGKMGPRRCACIEQSGWDLATGQQSKDRATCPSVYTVCRSGLEGSLEDNHASIRW
jgi:hypothetical protein